MAEEVVRQEPPEPEYRIIDGRKFTYEWIPPQDGRNISVNRRVWGAKTPKHNPPGRESKQSAEAQALRKFREK